MKGGDHMFIVDIHEYDYFTGNQNKQKIFEDKETAMNVYSQEKSKDFDYGDHYRKTTIFEGL
jgi:hypothetical protein